MHSKLYFAVPLYMEKNSDVAIPISYDYWIPLITYFSTQSNTVEIHCWNVEKKTIKELVSIKGTNIKHVLDEITILQTELHPHLINYLLSDYLDNMGRVKWFSLFFYNDETECFNSGHWGTEFFVHRTNKDEVHKLRTIMPNDTIFHEDI
ncbi:hypothetical protein ACSVDA_03305 [Cytobacillus sp. Hm23]